MVSASPEASISVKALMSCGNMALWHVMRPMIGTGMVTMFSVTHFGSTTTEPSGIT